MFAIIFGGEFFGFLGILLAVPTASLISVLVRFAVLGLGNLGALASKPVILKLYAFELFRKKFHLPAIFAQLHAFLMFVLKFLLCILFFVSFSSAEDPVIMRCKDPTPRLQHDSGQIPKKYNKSNNLIKQ